MINQKIVLCVPTLNPGTLAAKMVNALKMQTLKPSEILIIDSASDDDSINEYRRIGARILPVLRKDFDHGGTRNIVFRTIEADIYIFLTQDAIPTDIYALEKLVAALKNDATLALVYGRQAAADDASTFAKHARFFNYPEGSDVIVKKAEDIPRLGFKTAFCSNSFSAYRRSAMEKIDFFPLNTLFAEDSISAARLLQIGWNIGYVPDAVVLHSHDYTLKQDFCRYFDVGAFHSMNPWYLKFLGGAEGEGVKFVRSEYIWLKKEKISFPFIKVVIRNGIRFLGYKVGRFQEKVPIFMKRKMTTNRAFWNRRAVTGHSPDN